MQVTRSAQRSGNGSMPASPRTTEPAGSRSDGGPGLVEPVLEADRRVCRPGSIRSRARPSPTPTSTTTPSTCRRARRVQSCPSSGRAAAARPGWSCRTSPRPGRRPPRGPGRQADRTPVRSGRGHREVAVGRRSRGCRRRRRFTISSPSRPSDTICTATTTSSTPSCSAGRVPISWPSSLGHAHPAAAGRCR